MSDCAQPPFQLWDYTYLPASSVCILNIDWVLNCTRTRKCRFCKSGTLDVMGDHAVSAHVRLIWSLVMIVYETKFCQLDRELFCLPSVNRRVYCPTITLDRPMFSYCMECRSTSSLVGIQLIHLAFESFGGFSETARKTLKRFAFLADNRSLQPGVVVGFQ